MVIIDRPTSSSTHDALRTVTHDDSMTSLAPMPTISTLLLTIDQLWTRARHHARAPQSSPFLDPHLQRAITDSVESCLLARLIAASAPYHRTILTALRAPHASDYLAALPTLAEYTMSDTSMRLAIRHRLGVVPFTELASKCCATCPTIPFASDPDHFHSCKQHTRTYALQRHNNIMQVVMDAACTASYTAIREPNDHIRPLRQSLPSNKNFNSHADILLLGHGVAHYLDVSVTRPTSTTNLTLGRIQTSTLRSAVKRAVEKHSMYDELCEVNGYRMVPFVLETYGGLGADATKLMSTMAKQSTKFSEKEFAAHYYKRLSVTLQSANATIAERGMQSMHLVTVRHTGVFAPTTRPTIGMRGNPGATAAGIEHRRHHTVDAVVDVVHVVRPVVTAVVFDSAPTVVPATGPTRGPLMHPARMSMFAAAGGTIIVA